MTLKWDGKVHTMEIVPPSPDLCQVCGWDHPPEHPHNPESLYYQMAFHREHGRWPTWRDGLAHCSEEIRLWWTMELNLHGVTVDE